MGPLLVGCGGDGNGDAASTAPPGTTATVATAPTAALGSTAVPSTSVLGSTTAPSTGWTAAPTVLVLTRTAGFRHPSIEPAAKALVDGLGALGAVTVVDPDAARVTDAGLEGV